MHQQSILNLSASNHYGSRTKNKKLFPQKLWEIINDDNYSFCIRWSEDGQLVYLNRDEFEDAYLKTAENQFHTQKAISFVRQMNMYGFRKVDDCYYENDNFKRDSQHLLKRMIRKHPTKNIHPNNNNSNNSILNKNIYNNNQHHHLHQNNNNNNFNVINPTTTTSSNATTSSQPSAQFSKDVIRKHSTNKNPSSLHNLTASNNINNNNNVNPDPKLNDIIRKNASKNNLIVNNDINNLNNLSSATIYNIIKLYMLAFSQQQQQQSGV